LIPYHIATSSQYDKEIYRDYDWESENFRESIYIPSDEICDAYLDATGFFILK